MRKMKAGDDSGAVTGALFYVLVGPLTWAAHLFLVYAPQSALCAFRITGVARVDPPLIRGIVGVVTVVAAIALGLALWRPRSTAHICRASEFLEGENGLFLIHIMQVLAVLSLAGVLWAGATVLLLEPCPQLR